MLDTTSEVEISLLRRRMLRFWAGRGVTLRVIEGVVWITQERDTADIVLEVGQSFVLDGDGLALVSALKNSRLTIAPPPSYEDRAVELKPRPRHFARSPQRFAAATLLTQTR